MKYPTLITIVAILALGFHGAWGAEAGEGDVFVFYGVTPSKAHKKELAPVIGARRNGLLVDTAKGVKRIKFGQDGVVVEPAVHSTELYATIGEVTYGFANLAQSRRDAAYTADIEADVTYAENQIAAINANPNQNPVNLPRGVSRTEYMESLARDIEEGRRNQEEAFFGESEAMDTIYLAFEIVSESDLENVFGVVAVSHSSSVEGKDSVVLSIEKLGNLQHGVPQKIKFSVGTKEQMIRDPSCKFFLFTGDGTPIATNHSDGLKRFTREEFNAALEKGNQGS